MIKQGEGDRETSGEGRGKGGGLGGTGATHASLDRLQDVDHLDHPSLQVPLAARGCVDLALGYSLPAS